MAVQGMGRRCGREVVDAKIMGELEHLLQLQSGKRLECSEGGIGAIWRDGRWQTEPEGTFACAHFMLHLPLGVTVLELEEFLAFMLEAETSERGPRQMKPGEKNSFLWLRF